MAQSWFQRFIPDAATLRNHKSLQFLGPALHNPNLWHVNRRSIRNAAAVGVFCAFIPIPFQMVLAAFLAISFKANIPLSVGLVWLTNPVTMPVIFYLCYLLGVLLLGAPAEEFVFQASWDWLVQSLGTIGVPFLTGCIVSAVFFAIVCFLTVDRIWRFRTLRKWRSRNV